MHARITHPPLRHAFVLCAALTAAGCDRSPGEPPPAPTSRQAAAPHAEPGARAAAPSPHGAHAAQPTAAAGQTAGTQARLVWDEPTGWQRTPPSSPMRRAQYRIPHAEGETPDAELSVITFGPGQGGDVESNIQRWYGQVQQPDGRPTQQVATRTQFMVGSLTVTLVDAPGRVGGPPAPAMGSTIVAMPQAPNIERGRLLAAIVETPQGPWFFKITGPDRTVAAARPTFETLLRSLRMQDDGS